jgi:large subunit ribosomal protein L3
VVPGVKVGVLTFKDVKRVDVGGVSKGLGFQGVIRRHHFNAGPKSRGTKNIREPGSTGMHTDPARVIAGKKMPGHMGAVNRKVRNLEVVKIDAADNLLLVRGSVPGPRGAYVFIEESLV